MGNLLSLGTRRHVTLMQWKEKYGDVLSYYDGRTPVVVLSHFDTVRKVYSDDASTGRRVASAVRHDVPTLGPNMGLIFSEDELWKTHRRFALSTLRELGVGKNWLETVILREVEDLCQLLRDKNRKPLNPQGPLTISVSNVTCALILGQRFELTDPRFTLLTTKLMETVGATVQADSVAAAFPFLKWFPNKFRAKLLRVRDNIRTIGDFLGDHVREHAARMRENGERGDTADYVDAYLKKMQSGDDKTFDGTFTSSESMYFRATALRNFCYLKN